MKICIITNDVQNIMIMEQSPIEAIAKVIDFYFPNLLDVLLDTIEEVGISGLKESFGIKNKEMLTEDNWQEHLAEIFWETVAKGNVYEWIFFNDYYLYLNFFLQYPRLTEQKLQKGMNCSQILQEYQQRKLRGNVYRFIEDVEYMFVYDDGSDMDVLQSEDEMLYEIIHIDDIIAEYKKNEAVISG